MSALPLPGTMDPNARAASEEADTAAMFYRMSAARLRTRCLWAGLVLMATIFVPYEVIGGRGVFVWNVLPELTPSAKIAALAPCVAGLFLVLLGLRPKGREGLLIERPTSRAIAVIATFLATAGALWLGRDASAWGLLPLPSSMLTRPTPFIAVFALTAAGAALRFHPRARRGGAALLIASPIAATFFYLWPSRSEVPARTIARAVLAVLQLTDVRFQIGYGMVLLFVLAPALVAFAGIFYVQGVPKREHPGLSIFAVWVVPGMMLLFVYRTFITGGVGVDTIVTAFFALILLAVIGPMASALEVLVFGVAGPDPEADLLGGARPLVAGGVATALVLGLLVTSYVLGRPAPKGVDWKLGAGTPEWDKIYGEMVPAWQSARLIRDSHVRSDYGTGAEAQVATKARSRELLSALRGRPEGKDVLAAMESLASDVDDLELSGRAFGRLAAAANDAARRAELPYYLDPSVRIRTTEEATTRTFYLTPYRVKEVHGFRVGDAKFATLFVDGMTGDHHVHLGFSRDQDPFALVERSEIKWYSERLAKQEDTCGSNNDAVFDRRPCVDALTRELAALGPDLEKAVLLATERHELQHQIDGPHLPLSPMLADKMAGYAEESQDHANRELSAYIAEMTTKESPPALTLIHLYSFGWGRMRGAESWAAVVLMETLSGKPLRRGPVELEQGSYGAVFAEQVNRPAEELREAARRAWKAHFGADLVEPVRE